MGSFVKGLKRGGGLLTEKEEGEGAKGKIAPFLIPLDRNRGGDRGTGVPIPGGLGSAAARR